MKASPYTFALLLCTAVTVQAFTYTSDFEDPPFSDPLGEVAGTDGWVIDNATPDISFMVSSWDQGNGNPASQAAGLGGFFDTPGGPGTVVNLTHPVSIALGSLMFDVDFAVMESDPAFPGEDAFGFTFLGAGNPLFRVAFEPPGGNGDLEVAWYDSAGTRNVITPISQDIFYDGSHHLNVTFSPAGADTTFMATLTSVGSVNFGGTLTGSGLATVTDAGARMDVIGDGDNWLVFDNFSVVPEPQSVLLLVFGLVGMAARRRRQ